MDAAEVDVLSVLQSVIYLHRLLGLVNHDIMAWFFKRDSPFISLISFPTHLWYQHMWFPCYIVHRCYVLCLLLWCYDVMSAEWWLHVHVTTLCAKQKNTFRTCSFNTILFIYGILNEVVFMQRRETYSQALHYIRWIYIYEMLWEIIKYGQSVAHFSTISICYLFIVSNNAW